MEQMVKGAYFSEGFDVLYTKKEKKSGVFSKTWGGVGLPFSDF